MTHPEPSTPGRAKQPVHALEPVVTTGPGTGQPQQLAPASVWTEVCVVVLCASCGADCHDDGIVHLPALAAARAWFAAWNWADPARPVCPRCTVKAVCGRLGHQWGPWQDCRCRGSNPDHAAAGCRRLRWCRREHADTTCAAVQAGDRKPADLP